MSDRFGWEVTLVGAEFEMDDEGRLNLFGRDEPSGSPWPDEPGEVDEPAEPPEPWEDCGDGEEAWLRSLPPELRAEVEARPPVTVPPWEAGPAEARASFAGGGIGDEMLPGWLLGRVLSEATLDGFSGLSDDELTGVLRAWQRQVSSDQASLASAIRALTARRAAGSSRAAEHVSDELAVELTLTGRSAARQLELAAGLGRLPVVDSALLSGLIDWPRACVFIDELAVVDDETAGEIAERLADKAAGWTTGQLRAALARAVIAADPAAAERRKKQARKDTRVELWREGSGNAALAGRELRPSSAILLDKKLTSDAHWLAACGVPGSQDQLRTLAYTTLLSGRDLLSILDDPASWPQCDEPAAEADGTEPSCQSAGSAGANSARSASSASGSGASASGRDAAGPESAAGSIHLTMPMSAWEDGGEPGEVAGYGPIGAQEGREIADLLARDPATRWCLTLTGPDGRPIAHACAGRGPAAGEPIVGWAAGLRERLLILESGSCRHAREAAGYVPPPRLRHVVTVRQRRCTFPGCRRPARQCDLDHTIPFDKGGLTCECNLAPLCRRHHRAKQAPGWHLTQDQPGHMTWRLPSGRVYETVGDPY